MMDQYIVVHTTGIEEEFDLLEQARDRVYDLLEINESWLDDHLRHQKLSIFLETDSVLKPWTRTRLPLEQVGLRRELIPLIFPLSKMSPAWSERPELGLMQWHSYFGKPIQGYKLIPEEVVEVEGFNPDDFANWKSFSAKGIPDLTKLEVWKSKKRSQKRFIYIPVGITSDGRCRQCTVVDTEGIAGANLACEQYSL